MRKWLFDEELFVDVLVFDHKPIAEVAYRGLSDKWVAMTSTEYRYFSSHKQAIAWTERNV